MRRACARSGRAAVAALDRRASRRDARKLLIGDERISENPKLNNCFKGWNAAAHDWIVLADSNVLMPPDYLDAADGDAGAPTPVSSARRRPDRIRKDFGPRSNAPFLNTYQARWQYVADTLGFGFAQGKTMLWRRDILENAGGIRALGREAAEDAASTKLVRAQGLRVRLADAPFAQPLGPRSARDVWRRQARWAQLRRASFPLMFAPEIVSNALWPLAAMAFVAIELRLPALASVATVATLWYGAEMLLARRAGWPLTAAYPIHALTRDVMLPALWITGWIGSTFEWRGNPMRSVTQDEATQS